MNLEQGTYYLLPQAFSDSDSDKENPLKQDINYDSYLNISIKENSFVSHKITALDKNLSFISKLMLLTSILVCLLTPIIFVWFLPCPEKINCPLNVLNWDKTLENIELFGKIGNLNSKSWHTHNLVMLYKQNFQTENKLSGLISLKLHNGEMAWNYTLKSAYKSDCGLLDVTHDKIKDCLIESNRGLHMIDGEKGTKLWEVSRNNILYGSSFSIDFPYVFDDLDDDNVGEILVSSNTEKKSNSILTIISGKTGDLLDQIEIATCPNGHIVHSNFSFIILSCKEHKLIEYYNITKDIIVSNLKKSENSILGLKVNFEKSRKLHEVSGRILNFKNEGLCPYDCKIIVSVIEKKTNKKIAGFLYNKSFLFEPITFSFKSKKNMSGFILKLWEWTHSKDYFSNTSQNDTFNVNFIKEKIIIIMFDEDRVEKLKMGSIEIIQLCILNENKNVCQPSVASQNNSMLVEDLDYDGYLEFISYSSTYKNNSQNYWKLISNVKIVRLESELPKVYQLEN